MNDSVITVKDLTKTFKVPHEKRSTLKEYFVNFFRRRSFERLKALDNASFSVRRGEFLGIIGRNGSGKSTLLKVIAGILKPNGGKVAVNGTIAPFLELGVGFQPDLSARDNVYLYGAILGLSRQTIDKKFNGIIKFAELEKFVDQKLKNFSSGMQVRLAFATAINSEADILLVDEVLAVGDIDFQGKCREVFLKLKKVGKTVIFVSHDIDSVKQFCTKVLLINDGKVIEHGNPEKVVNDYFGVLRSTESEKLYGDLNNKESRRWGSHQAIVDDAWIEDDAGQKIMVVRHGRDFSIKFRVKFKEAVDRPIFGITVKNAQGDRVFITNTFWQSVATGAYQSGEERIVEFALKNELPTGRYFVSPAIASTNRENFYDWREEYLEFASQSKITSGGKVDFHHKISIY